MIIQCLIILMFMEVKVPLSTNFSARVPLVTGKIEEKDLVEVTNLIKRINTDDFLKKEIIGYQ